MKRLNTRLKELEHHSGTNAVEMSAAEKKMLIEVLARRDALFWPWRWTLTVRPPVCEILRRQREYLNESVGISAKADGKSDWKEAHLQRRSLIDGGMLTATHSSGQVTSLFLTPLGESFARALVGDRLVDDLQVRILVMTLVTMSAPKRTPVREHVLLGVPSFGNPEEWADQTELMLPALTSGVVSACSDTMGRMLFTPIEGKELPRLPDVAVESEEWCDGAYIEAFNAERHVLTNAEPRDPAEVFIPIPATVLWPTSESDTNEK